MAQDVQGNPSAILKAEEPFFDPDYGYGYRQVWTGTKNAVLTKLQQAAFAGNRARVTKITAGSWQCEIQVPYIPDDSQLDRWEIDTEWNENSIFSVPGADAEAQNYVTLVGAGSMAAYKHDIEEDARNGDPLRMNPSVFPIAYSFWLALSRGQESYETRRCVLRRRRSRPTNWATPVVIDGVETVFTTPTLKFVFGIPDPIYLQLPPDPAYLPLNTVWAWKARTDTSSFILALNRMEEQKDWVFAAWNTQFYRVL